MRVAIIITFHNRRVKTLNCIETIINKNKSDFDFFMVDDGSSDGTQEAIREKYPYINIIQGCGNLYWNGGMYLAFSEAIKNDYDLYFWINDDVSFYDNSLDKMIECYYNLALSKSRLTIIVGTTEDPNKNAPTYGGVVAKNKFRPIKYSLVTPTYFPLICDTMNGNCVLIPREVVQVVGNLDPEYAHGMGDFDYGNRARQLGCKIYIFNGIVGSCKRNKATGTFADASIPIRRRLQLLNTPTGLHLKSWIRYTKKYSGLLWIAYVASPIAKIIFTSIIFKLKKTFQNSSEV